MSDCSGGVNGHFKTIQARLDRIDDDLIAHYAGISQLVAGLAANPLTAGAAATSLPIYNFSGLGQRALARLKGLIPGAEKFKQLQHLDAAALVSSMAGNFAKVAANMAVTAAEQISLAAQQKVDAELALAEATARGAAEEVLGPLRQAAESAAQLLFSADSALSSIKSYTDSIDDISNCRARSMVLGSI
jgi:uncharacterized membrane-anchored protein YhcB (DUF1043 family)